MTITELIDLLVACGVPRGAFDEMTGRLMRDMISDQMFDEEVVEIAMRHEDALGEKLAARAELPAIVFGASTIDLTLTDALNHNVLLQHGVLPVADIAGTVTVAIGDPATALGQTLHHLGAALGRRVSPVISAPQLVHAATELAFRYRQQGARTLRGARSPDDNVTITLARPPLQAAVPRADSVARALAALLGNDTAPPQPTPDASKAPNTLATLRLRQVAQTGPASPAARPAVEHKDLVERAANRPYVLIVEDDDAIAGLIVKACQVDGYEPRHIASGEAVSDALAQRCPDLIVLDAMLPGVHGFEICAGLKASPDWSAVPIVVVSAIYRGFERAKEVQEQHGADAFVEKPFHVEHLRRVLADLLDRPPAPRPEDTMNDEQASAVVAHHIALGDLAAAQALVERWLSLSPLSARAWLEWGHLATRRSDTLTALSAYERAAIYDRRSFAAQTALASLYEHLGFVRRAKATWRAAVACAPDGATAERIRALL